MQPSLYWPIGSSLRFTSDVVGLPGCAYLAETAVLVLSPPKLLPAALVSGKTRPQMMQKIYSFAAGIESWVQPEFLEPIPVSMLSAYRSKRWPVRKS